MTQERAMILATIRAFKSMLGDKDLQDSFVPGDAPLTKPEVFIVLGGLLDAVVVAVEKMP